MKQLLRLFPVPLPGEKFSLLHNDLMKLFTIITHAYRQYSGKNCRIPAGANNTQTLFNSIFVGGFDEELRLLVK